jgi:hypothetical protein
MHRTKPYQLRYDGLSCSVLVLRYGSPPSSGYNHFYPEYGDDTFLGNVGSTTVRFNIPQGHNPYFHRREKLL